MDNENVNQRWEDRVANAIEQELIEFDEYETYYSEDSPQGSPDTWAKFCWICFSYEGEDPVGSSDWVSPCMCRGSTQWVHQACILRWITERLNQNDSIEAHCPQCKTYYTFTYKEVNWFVRILNTIGTVFNWMSPLLASSAAIFSIYYLSKSYGIFTMMQVTSDQDVSTIIKDPLVSFFIPLIPFGLLLCERIKWEKTMLLWVQHNVSQQSLLRTILPSFIFEPVDISPDPMPLSMYTYQSTSFCVAISLPTVATMIGRVIFRNSSYSNLKKTLLGGLMYKGLLVVFRMYRRQHNTIREKSRQVSDYHPDIDSDSDSDSNSVSDLEIEINL